MLATARGRQPSLTALMMDEATFSAHAPRHAVVERVKAELEPPDKLDAQEQALYRKLYTLEKGRLEQEFLPAEVVERELICWRSS